MVGQRFWPPNKRVGPTVPSALRLIRDPLGRQRIKASLRRRESGPEAERARGRAAGRGQKGQSGRMAVGRVSLRPLVSPAGTWEPAAPMSGRAAGMSLRAQAKQERGLSGRSGPEGRARPGREGGWNPWSGQVGSARGLWQAAGRRNVIASVSEARAGFARRGPAEGATGAGKGGGQGFPSAAPMRWRAKGGLPLPAGGALDGSGGKPNPRAVAGAAGGGSGGSPWVAGWTGEWWLAGRNALERAGWLGGPLGGPTCG